MMFRIPKLIIPLLPCLAAGQVAIREAPGKVEISLDGRPFSNLYAGSEWAKPFLHPLRAASGTVVTRGYPVDRIAGENQDHVWHHGLWWAHGDVNGVHYWRDKGLETTGRIVLRGKPRLSGASLAFESDFVPPDRKSPGSVSQTFRFATAGGLCVAETP